MPTLTMLSIQEKLWGTTCHRCISKFIIGDRKLYLYTKTCFVLQENHKYLQTCIFLTMQEAVTQDKNLLKIITTKGSSTTSCNQRNQTQSLTVAADTDGRQASSFYALA